MPEPITTATVLVTLTDPTRPPADIDRDVAALAAYPHVIDAVRVVTAYDILLTLEGTERALASAVLRIQRAAPVGRTLTLTHARGDNR